jgi:hypothetical protein
MKFPMGEIADSPEDVIASLDDVLVPPYSEPDLSERG